MRIFECSLNSQLHTNREYKFCADTKTIWVCSFQGQNSESQDSNSFVASKISKFWTKRAFSSLLFENKNMKSHLPSKYKSSLHSSRWHEAVELRLTTSSRLTIRPFWIVRFYFKIGAKRESNWCSPKDELSAVTSNSLLQKLSSHAMTFWFTDQKRPKVNFAPLTASNPLFTLSSSFEDPQSSRTTGKFIEFCVRPRRFVQTQGISVSEFGGLHCRCCEASRGPIHSFNPIFNALSPVVSNLCDAAWKD